MPSFHASCAASCSRESAIAVLLESSTAAIYRKQNATSRWLLHPDSARYLTLEVRYSRSTCFGVRWAPYANDALLFAGVEAVAPHLRLVEARVLLQEDHVDGSRGAVALLGDDDLRLTLEFRLFRVVFLVDFRAEDEADHVGVLLDRS